jgi:hypothetical protein
LIKTYSNLLIDALKSSAQSSIPSYKMLVKQPALASQ